MLGFLSSRPNLLPPPRTPSPGSECCSLHPLRWDTLAREGGEGTQYSDEGTNTLVLCVCYNVTGSTWLQTPPGSPPPSWWRPSTAAASRRSPPRSGPDWSLWFRFAPAPRQLQRPHRRARRRLQSRYRRRYGYPDSCQRTSGAPATSGVSRTEAVAAPLRELVSRRSGEGPPPGVRPEAAPEAAAQAAGAGGRKAAVKVWTKSVSSGKTQHENYYVTYKRKQSCK